MVTIGTKAGDVIVAGLGNDIVYSLAGNDWLGDNSLDLTPSNDNYYGWAGNDTLTSYGGMDSMFGGRGSDTFEFHGTSENITIRGGKGDDFLIVNPNLFAPGEYEFLMKYADTTHHMLLDLAGGGVLDLQGVEGLIVTDGTTSPF